MIETFSQDVRYAFRMLLKNPGFTAIAVIALTLGIGANTAIFSVVNAVLLRPLPYPESDRLVMIFENNPSKGWDTFSVSPANFLDWRSQNKSFEDLAAFTGAAFNLAGSGDPERIAGSRVSSSLFSILRVNAEYGRVFTADEDQDGHGQVVVLGHGLWERRFGADKNLVGKQITLSDKSYTVVGIMPLDFQFPSRAEIWTPMAFAPREIPVRGGHYINVIGRLKQGVTFAQAKANMDGITEQLVKQYPNSNGGWGVNPKPLLEVSVGNIRPQLQVLLVAVAFVLLIACANVANLLLAKASGRQREIAIRTALGAGRGRVIRQLLTESVMLAIAGGTFGLLLAYWGVKVLISISPDTIPRSKTIGIDGQALGFTLLVSLLTGIFFGLVPALQASKPDLNHTLKEGGRSGSSGAAQRYMRNVLVVSEIALSLILLIGAGLLIKSFIRLRQVDPGFKSEGVLTMQISLPRSKYGDDPQQIAFAQQLLQKMKTIPGIESSSVTTTAPLLGGSIYGFTFEGNAELAPQDVPSAEYYSVSSDYFQTMRMRLMKGRAFTEYDSANANKVAIINESMVRKFFPHEDPIGRRMNITNGYQASREIIGIIGDVKTGGIDAPVASQMYVPILQEPDNSLIVTVRGGNNPLSLVGALRSQVQEIDPTQPIANVKTMDEVMASSIAPRRLTMVLLGIFAAVALILAAVGIYGVMSYSVTQRTHEIGIRMALGAKVVDVLKMVIGQGMLLTLAGLVIGLIGALGLSWLIESLLFGVSSRDPWTFFAISGLLTLVALFAVYLPARRAAKTDPIIALRFD